jgi:hypothetical protein
MPLKSFLGNPITREVCTTVMGVWVLAARNKMVSELPQCKIAWFLDWFRQKLSKTIVGGSVSGFIRPGSLKELCQLTVQFSASESELESELRQNPPDLRKWFYIQVFANISLVYRSTSTLRPYVKTPPRDTIPWHDRKKSVSNKLGGWLRASLWAATIF